MNLPFSHKGLKNHPTIVSKKKLTASQKYADALSSFMGSWTFLIIFLLLLVVWMTLNVYAWMSHWDPYPFILLNLVLSCLSAMQAPIILMSQNRQAERDRIEAKYDYAVNRKTEREVQDIQEDLEEIKRLIRALSKKKK